MWWLDGSIECYERFQIVAIGAVSVLSVAPLVAGGVMWRWRDEAGLGPYAKAIRHILTKGYQDNRRWILFFSRFAIFLLKSLLNGTDGIWE